MGFTKNLSERVRINISEAASLVMADDMFQFQISSRSAFVNIVFRNFHADAKASIMLYLERRRQELTSALEADGPLSAAQKAVVEQLLSREEKELREQVSFRNRRENRFHSQLYRINIENMDYLQSEECEEAGPYQQKLGLYLKCILEEYASLPYKQREHIVWKESYDQITSALKNHNLLKVTLHSGKSYYVYPWSLEEDALSTREYLTGMSQEVPFRDSVKYPASYRIPRMKKITVYRQSGRLTKAETAQLKDALLKRGAQFLLGDETFIRVRLTPEGVCQYQTQLSMRPAFDPALTQGNEYVFLCTEHQAEHYFFKFGKEAEILSPPSLRKRFQRQYQDAALVYQDSKGASLLL